MKIKRLLVGLSIGLVILTFTGCANTENLQGEMYIQGMNKQYIAYDLEEWEDLKSEIDILRRYNGGTEIWIDDMDYDNLENSIWVGTDKSYIYVRDIDCEQGEKAVKYVARHTGDEIYEVLEAVRRLESDVIIKNGEMDGEDQMVTKTLGNYSVIGIKREGKIGFYVMHEPFTLISQVDKTFINQFKTDGFLLKAFSKGKQNSLIEITTPSCMIRTYGSPLYNSTSYYQFFRNQNNELTKMRMVINVYEQNGIYKEEFAPLENAIVYLGGAESFNEKIQNEVSNIIGGYSNGRKIKSGDLTCTIKKNDGLIYQEKLIEIVIE